MKMKLLVALLAGVVAVPAFAQSAGDLLVRVRAVHIDPEDKSSGEVLPADAVTVSAKTIPEIDFSYFFTKNIAAELILTVPQKHDVEVNGVKIGTFKHLPPTLTLQYHFMPDASFRPYIGAGVNYTYISDVELGGLTLDRSSTGLAVQAGFDYAIGQDLVLNVDVKKIRLRTDVEAGGTKITELTLDPLLIGIGIGKRF